MHIHILGICGTFMGGIAQLARAAGHRVTGCDANVYPPMSDQLASAGIELIEGFDESQVALRPDLYVIGNAISRGNPLLEKILNDQLPYTSGPQWLGETILGSRHVLAVAGNIDVTDISSTTRVNRVDNLCFIVTGNDRIRTSRSKRVADARELIGNGRRGTVNDFSVVNGACLNFN